MGALVDLVLRRSAARTSGTPRSDVATTVASGEVTAPEPWCRAPFIAMDLDGRGNVQACCANALYPLGNVTTHRLPDIWRGHRATLLRDAMVRSDLTLGCTVCRHRRDGDGGAVPADYYAGSFPDARLDDPYPHLLSFSLHNTCNLECIMCGADSSSRIRTRRHHLAPLPHVYDDQFFDDVVPFLEACGAIDFVGGEPFLVREHHRIWDLLIESGRRPRCSVTTNGTVWNDRVERVLDAIDHNICLSFDGTTAATFESVRVGATLAEVMDNLHRFRAYTLERGTQMNLSFSLVRQNWFELGSVLLLGTELGLPVTVQTVIEPEFGAQRSDDDELRTIVEALETEDRRIRHDLGHNAGVWDIELDKLRTELSRRRSGTPIERIMEPPSHVRPSDVAARLAAWHDAAGAPADAADRPLDVTLATIRARLARWTDESPVWLGLDDRLVVTDAGPDAGRVVPGIDVGPVLGLALDQLLATIAARLGAAMWVIESFEDDGDPTTTLWFGDEHRDKEGMLVRLVAVRHPGGLGVLMAADGTMWPEQRAAAVPVELGRRSV